MLLGNENGPGVPTARKQHPSSQGAAHPHEGEVGPLSSLVGEVLHRNRVTSRTCNITSAYQEKPGSLKSCIQWDPGEYSTNAKIAAAAY